LLRVRLVFDFDEEDSLPSVLIEGVGEFDELGFERSTRQNKTSQS